MVSDSSYYIGEVIADAAFRVQDRHPEGEGLWKMEADKVAWRDPATGLDCIIRRSKEGGYLSGYVGVPPQHPLYGFEGRALEALGIHPHGGVDHGAPCEEWTPEPISVCHVREQNAAKDRNKARAAAAAEIDRQHDHAWWFGFSCDKPGDLQPSKHGAAPTVRGVCVGLKAIYRDENYVLAHVVDLAAQLHAIGAGRDLPPATAPAGYIRGRDPDYGGDA
ncbi:hypothetical protein [Sphingomonas sp. CFBP 13733]|uniref:hypothetical protein n=1 Tax=Sphingomonas sp. CFBP 13733 TaxID=2775291 RepID=UPI001784F384|nr:hypothetical protein [Sphingomonas sp. CFBP 13733]MBD8640267.1 hypothetical protein [Sphingomonas sp. CFBP 13733]